MNDKPTRKAAIVKRYLVPNRLATLVDRPGGKWRDEAIAAAARNLEAMRETSLLAIGGLIDELDPPRAKPGAATTQRLAGVERAGNQIITLAETFGLAALAEACKRLCDLAYALRESGDCPSRPLAVHVGAIRLLAPGPRQLDDASARLVLDELGKMHVHFGISAQKEIPVD